MHRPLVAKFPRTFAKSDSMAEYEDRMRRVTQACHPVVDAAHGLKTRICEQRDHFLEADTVGLKADAF